VRILENNPFSNLPKLRIVNNSPHFIFEDGALYNKTMTTLFYYEHGHNSQTLVIPEGVKIIGRHSFYNCQNIESVTIPKTVDIIGYNPFTNCSKLCLDNNSPNFVYDNGTLYDKDKSVIIYHSIPDPADTFVVPDTVHKIGRSAFFGCRNLKKVIIQSSVSIIDRSAFAKCINLKEVSIPDSIEVIDEWAFSNCSSLKEINIPNHTLIETHTFLNSPAKVSRREVI